MAPTKLPTVAEAYALLTAPGQPLETEDLVIHGRKVTAFKNLPKTFRSFLIDKCRQFSGRTFLSSPLPGDGREYVSFDEVLDRSLALAVWLRERGVGQGDGVGIGGYNSPEWVVAFVATHLVGGVTVVLNASLNAESLTHCLKLTQPKVTLLDGPTAETLAGVWEDKMKPHNVGPLYTWGTKAQAQVAKLPALTATKAQKDDMVRGDFLVDFGADNDAHVFFTSGTTGLPKAVLSTQRMGLTNFFSGAFPSQVAALRKGAALPPPPSASLPQKVHLLAIPMFHVTGCLSWLIRGFNTGTKLVFMDRWNVAKAAQLIVDEKVNMVGGVPAIATQLVQSDLIPKGIDFDGVAYGGAPAPARLATDVKKRWPSSTIMQGYGMTETNAYACGIAGDDYLAKPASTGPPVPICRIKIVDPDTRKELPVGQTGVICIAGVQIMKEYVRDSEATAKAIDSEGYIDTGDIGYVDDENFLYIADRAKDIIIRGGENVASGEVENAILRDERISQCIAVPVPDDVLGELVGVLYALKPGKSASEKSILDAAAPFIRKAARPDIAVQYKENTLPTNANGKFVKKDLKGIVIEEWERRKADKKERARL